MPWGQSLKTPRLKWRLSAETASETRPSRRSRRRSAVSLQGKSTLPLRVRPVADAAEVLDDLHQRNCIRRLEHVLLIESGLTRVVDQGQENSQRKTRQSVCSLHFLHSGSASALRESCRASRVICTRRVWESIEIRLCDSSTQAPDSIQTSSAPRPSGCAQPVRRTVRRLQ